MRRVVGAALALLSFGVSIPALCADSASQARNPFQRAYDQQDAALNHCDLNGFLALYAPSWTYVVKGQVGATRVAWRQSWTQNFKAFAQTHTTTTQTTTIQQISLGGNQAMVIADRRITMRYTVHQALPPRLAFLKDPSTWVERDRDTWQKTGQGWLMARTDRLFIHYVRKAKTKALPSTR